MEQIRRWVSVMTRIRFQTKSGAKGSAWSRSSAATRWSQVVPTRTQTGQPT